MTEKYSLLPINPQQLTPAQTAIKPPDIEYTKTSQPLIPVYTPLLVIRKHIPIQSDIGKLVSHE